MILADVRFCLQVVPRMCQKRKLETDVPRSLNCNHKSATNYTKHKMKKIMKLISLYLNETSIWKKAKNELFQQPSMLSNYFKVFCIPLKISLKGNSIVIVRYKEKFSI